MAENSKIEWTNHTANLWHGRTKVHEGCDNCYAEATAIRWKNDVWGNDKPRKLVKSFFNDLNKYQKLAAEKNEMHRVFVGSMMDIFEKPMPLIGSDGKTVVDDMNSGDLRNEFFNFITANRYPNLMFLLLTKRPSNINKYIPESWKQNPPSNVMFGTSPVNQQTFDTLIPQLLKVNGKRFLSMEPQLGEINLTLNLTNAEVQNIHWIIQGGESGHHKRPFNIDWAYYMYDQCIVNQIPYFFKQIDKVKPIPDDLFIREFPI